MENKEEFNLSEKEKMIYEINKLFGFVTKRRRYYDSEKTKENYQKRKELEVIKHIENCREDDCIIKHEK